LLIQDAASGHWVHDLDPTLVKLGPIPIRYYSLAYLLGLVLGMWLLQGLARRRRIALDKDQVADMVLFHVLLGVIVGGRLGYVLFYDLQNNLHHPLNVFKVWQGGMASHGGMIGVMVALWLFARQRKVPFLHLLDLAALAAPIGLCLGRVANFINGELWGRVTDVPWGVIFPAAGEPLLPRHPSQLYEAAGEGLFLFLILMALQRRFLPRTGTLAGVFCLGYSVARIVCEQFREPDRQIGFQPLGLTRGQWLTFAVVAFGAFLLVQAARGKTPSWSPPPEKEPVPTPATPS